MSVQRHRNHWGHSIVIGSQPVSVSQSVIGSQSVSVSQSASVKVVPCYKSYVYRSSVFIYPASGEPLEVNACNYDQINK